MTFSKCPHCNHYSVKPVNTSNVIGVIECSRGNKSIARRVTSGIKCMLPSYNYSNLKLEFFDGHGHKVA
jgi:transcription elongation factor Elf1